MLQQADNAVWTNDAYGGQKVVVAAAKSAALASGSKAVASNDDVGEAVVIAGAAGGAPAPSMRGAVATAVEVVQCDRRLNWHGCSCRPAAREGGAVVAASGGAGGARRSGTMVAAGGGTWRNFRCCAHNYSKRCSHLNEKLFARIPTRTALRVGLT